jgi:DNA-binding response OmpR family regulator/chromosome segregation ATPase
MDRTERIILFVEDDSFVLTMYRSRLQNAGFRVESAGDGLAAIELLPQVRPDAVVLDLMLPKLHGLEVLKFIRTDVNLRTTPVVVLSNVYMEGLAAKAVAAGSNVGILKTQCTPTKLVRILRELIGNAPAAGEPSSEPKDRKAAETDSRDAVIEEACRKSARIDLLRHAQTEIAQIRQEYLAFLKMGVSKEGLECLNSLYRRVRFLSARAGLGECKKITEVSSALEAVLFEIVFNSSRATKSALHTTVQAVDCLARLIQTKDVASDGPNLKHKVLAVDDDKVCNRAVVTALKRANFDAMSVEDPQEALAVLEAHRFDLVLLDVNMPGLDGFQVCEKLRCMPQHKTTPVIFVTINGDFESRTRGVLAGGDDLIAKPISPLELTLKVTIRLLQPGLSGGAALTNVDEAQTFMSPADTPTTGAVAASGDSKSRIGVLLPAAPAPADHTHGEQAPTEPTVALVRRDRVGANGFDLGGLLAPEVSPSAGRMAAMVNRGFGDGHRPDGQLASLRVVADDLHEKLREQESTVGRLRQENADLKSASQEHIAELAQLNGRLEKARAENAALARQAANLKAEHDANREEQGKLEAKTREQEAARTTVAALQDKYAAIKRQLENVSQSLAHEAERRAAAEGQAGELAGSRKLLEQELVKRKQDEEQLRRELEEQKARLQAQGQKLSEEQGKLEVKTQEQEAARTTIAALQDEYAAVKRQLENVSQSLTREAERRAAAEGQAGELAGSRKLLEQELGQRKQAEEQFRRELENQKARLHAQVKRLSQEECKLKAKTQEHEASRSTLAALQDKYTAVQRQLESVSQSLAHEAERRVVAETQVSEVAELRGSLEQELTQRKQDQEQLRRELEEQKARLQAQAQKLSEEQGKLKAKTQEQEAARTTAAALQDKYTAVQQQLESVSQSLAREAERRAAAEGQAGELAGSRKSLEQKLAQRRQAEEQLRREVEEQKARLQAQGQKLSEEQGKLEAKTQEQEAAQTTAAALQDKYAAIKQQLESVTQSLACEAERRAAAEGQAGELAGSRKSLEQKLAQRKQAEEQLRRELEEQKARLQAQGQKLSEEQGKLEAKTREQEAARTTVAALQDKYTAVQQQLESVSQSLAREAERRAAAERQAGELAGWRKSLEQELTQRKQAEEQLQRELEEQKARLQAQAQKLSEEQGKLEAKVQEQEAAQTTAAALQDKYAAIKQQLESVTQSLACEAERRGALEGQAGELAGLRSALEAELVRRKQAEQQLRRELEGQTPRLEAQAQKLSEAQDKLEAKTQEQEAARAAFAALQDKHTAVEQQLQSVSQTLAREAERRATAESRAGELTGLRSALEQELAQRKEAEKQLRRELERQKARLQAQAQKLSEGQDKLEAKTQEQEAALTTLAALQDKYTAVQRQLDSVSQSLAHEAERRAAAESQANELAGSRSSLEQELAQRKQAEEELRSELEEQKARLQAQGQKLSEEQGKLEAKTQEQEAARSTLAALQKRYAAVQCQLDSVSQLLADEAERRAVAESQAGELTALRGSLQQELEQRKQAEAQLRSQLEEQKARLQAQAQKLSEEQGKLEAKTQEQEAARTTAAALQDKYTAVQRQLESVSQSLAHEAERRAAAESHAGELAGWRKSLEQELTQRKQAEEQLQRELEEQKASSLLNNRHFPKHFQFAVHCPAGV